MEFTNVSKTGTGDSYVQWPKAIQIALTNTPITPKQACVFVAFLQRTTGQDFRQCKINFANGKPGRNSWGIAYTRENIIALYRHDTMTFLHELAHLDPKTHRPGRMHGPAFGRTLDGFIVQWLSATWQEVLKAL